MPFGARLGHSVWNEYAPRDGAGARLVYETLEFVLLDKRKKEQQRPSGGERVQVVPKIINVTRRTPSRFNLRTRRPLANVLKYGLQSP